MVVVDRNGDFLVCAASCVIKTKCVVNAFARVQVLLKRSVIHVRSAGRNRSGEAPCACAVRADVLDPKFNRGTCALWYFCSLHERVWARGREVADRADGYRKVGKTRKRYTR